MKCPKAKMDSRDVTRLVLNALQHDYLESGIKVAYKFASPQNKKNTGPFSRFANMIREEYQPMLNSSSWGFRGPSKKHDHNHCKCRVYVIKDGIKYIYKFRLSRQYDWKNDKPIWDQYSDTCLNKYWRVDSVELVKSKPIEHFGGDGNSRGSAYNIYGNALEYCSHSPKTGFYRDGYCKTGPEDRGTHTVCARVTDEFLKFSKSRGNDLITPSGSFPGLKDGNYWCLCANRYKEAKDNGINMYVKKTATNKKTLNYTRI